MISRFRLTKTQVILLSLLSIFWLSFGRGIFGSVGWMSLLFVMFGIPIIVAVSSIIVAIATTARDKKNKQRISLAPSITIWTWFAILFLIGIFIVDGGDTGGSVSIATNILGAPLKDTSNIIFLLLFYGSLIVAISAIGLLTLERYKDYKINQFKPGLPEAVYVLGLAIIVSTLLRMLDL